MSELSVRRIVLALLPMTLAGVPLSASQLRPITVQDCVRTRRVVDQEVQISPDGSRVAYVVKAPDVVSNRNDYRLYVRDLVPHQSQENGRLLLRADGITTIRWTGRGEIMARVLNRRKNGDDLESRLITVNTETGELEAVKLPYEIQLHSVSADGKTIAYSVRTSAGLSAEDQQQTRRDEERGFRLIFGAGSADSYEHLPEFDVYLANRAGTGEIHVRKLCFRESRASPTCSSLRNIIGLNLSPDGKRLLLTYSAKVIPPSWANQIFVAQAKTMGTLFDTYVLGLYEIESGDLRPAFNYPGALIRARWLPDSEHYAVVGPSAFGTTDAATEAEAAVASGQVPYYMNRFQHVHVIDAATGAATIALHREGGEPGNFKFWGDLPIFWNHGQEMLVRVSGDAVSWMAVKNGKWEQRQLIRLPLHGSLSSLSGDGRTLAGVTQASMVPPNIFAFDLEDGRLSLLTDLNPEYREIQLGHVERFEWTNQYGSRCAGLIIKPVGFEAGKRYPLVFLAANTTDDFISDAPYATTSYAPQSLASAGMIVVLAHYPADNKVPRSKFPGEMSTAYNWMAMVEAVVDLLVEQKMVDPDRVGIGGFSRTSWLTDFVLTHSTHNFVAVSSADSGIYNYGTYFRNNSREDAKGDETQLGGPPYGKTLANWLNYAPPFNAERVRAAVLMEYTGLGEHGFEFFTALSRLGKAVEFYRYPKGKHPLDTPLERVASLQRNIDWFRFWLQGYERPSSEDPEQYPRWRAMRVRRRAEEHK